MTVARVHPGRLIGRVSTPPSKSYTHRALVLGRSSPSLYRIESPLNSDDTHATREGLRQLGCRIRSSRGDWELRPGPLPSRRRGAIIPCGESGTTLRFLAAVAATLDRPVRLSGDRRLAERPLLPLLASLRSHGVLVSFPSGKPLPVDLKGPLQPGSFRVDASSSSQFVSALLLVLPFLSDGSTVAVTGPSVSRTYVESTLAALRFHGLRIDGPGGAWSIPGRQRLRGRRFPVPPDASSAAYLWVGAAVTGGRVVTEGAWGTWPQADLLALDVLRRAGAIVRRTPRGVWVEGRACDGFEVDLTDSPDLYPLLAILAAATPGRSRLTGAPQLEVKESDRRRGTLELLRRVGVRTLVEPDGLTIRGQEVLDPATGFVSSDHRLVMSAAVAALAASRPSRLPHREAVQKSYPGFWSDLATLGAEVTPG